MADETTKQSTVETIVQIPGMTPVAVVAVRLPNGEIALRHPSELRKLPAPPAKREGTP